MPGTAPTAVPVLFRHAQVPHPHRASPRTSASRSGEHYQLAQHHRVRLYHRRRGARRSYTRQPAHRASHRRECQRTGARGGREPARRPAHRHPGIPRLDGRQRIIRLVVHDRTTGECEPPINPVRTL
ncbi:unnamed protein product [Mycena citricolor]|uniref:Uncharacterized protein n=1 Tax=Mycena citricolor TaxID=2018698 RepID=A0AAD2Q5G5_9AGAR|nr:unnamed protein product [Mycena citricolor]